MADKKQPPKPIMVPIEWHIDDTIHSRYVTNLVVQCTDQECTISFFEIRAPLLVGTDEENAAKAKKLKSVRAECVSRIAITTNRVPEFVEAIKSAYERYQTNVTSSKVDQSNGTKNA